MKAVVDNLTNSNIEGAIGDIKSDDDDSNVLIEYEDVPINKMDSDYPAEA